MKQVYKCDFCDEVFESEAEAKAHEEKCGYNPDNVINDKLLFRLSMIYEDMQKIIACALYEVAKGELDYLYSELFRADDMNCPYTIKRNQSYMLWSVSTAKEVTNKHEGRNSSTYKDVIEQNPELFQAVVDTLERKAWNEY